MIRINESKTLAKHTSCECKCKFDGIKCNSNQKWNNNKCRRECKNPRKHHVCEKDYIWNPRTCTCENGKFLEIIIGDLVFTCDEILEMAKTIPTNFNENEITCNTEKFYILVNFLINYHITIDNY